MWNKEARSRDKDRMSPRQAWRAIQAGMPEDVIISSDIGNNCAIGNAYPTFEKGRKYLAPGLFGPCGYGFPSILGAKIGCPDTPVIGFAGDGAFGISMNEMSSCARKEWPAITMVIFRNYQWGAEKRNSILWFDDNFVGTELDPELSYAKVADACGLKGVTTKTMEETTKAIKESCENQKKGTTTFIEIIFPKNKPNFIQNRLNGVRYFESKIPKIKNMKAAIIDLIFLQQRVQCIQLQ